MAYKALYRKYRPKNFEEVVGQQHIIATLKNAIINNKLAHAYLFCGPRGTGKTTVAKILAKVVNCLSEDNKPCCQCSSCLDIQEGSHPDVVELDAASNNGVDEVRELIEKVKYAPMNGKYKVYIIDEVHMMTQAAFNALLKTLEEPPEYCIFILATTDPQKVLPTIISRCQRFDFHKIPASEIVPRLTEVCKEENINCTEEATMLIAELADGGMRDSLSILDQCAAYSRDQITAESVSEVYGVTSISQKMTIYRLINEKNAMDLINEVINISNRGLDIQRLTIDLVNVAKECVVYSYGKDMRALTMLKKEQAEEILRMFGASRLLSFIDCLVDAQTKYREATNSLIYFEVALLKMTDLQNQPVSVNQVQRTPQPAVVAQVESRPAPKQPIQAEAVKPTVTASANGFNTTAIAERLRLEDDEVYNILTKANKILKEKDFRIISQLNINGMDAKSTELLSLVKTSAIMASSSDYMILTVADRESANCINNKRAQVLIGSVLKEAGILKTVYAITTEERDFHILKFKSKIKEEPIRKSAEEDAMDNTKALDKLFGKDGYDVVGK